jgi:hypothetical protein
MARIRIFRLLTAWALFALPASGQSQAVAKPSGPFSYDISQEITLNGTVSSVLKKPGPGMIMGDHLLVATPSGTVDASLGNSALQGKYGMTVTEGQQVQLTGVMKTLKGKQVFLARLVKVDGQLYTIRNEHGFPISLRSAGSQSPQQGVQP